MKNSTPLNMNKPAKDPEEPSCSDKKSNMHFNEIPSELVIKNILNYSKALSIQPSSEIGFIETVLN